MRERTIRPGDGVILLTGSANQDEAAFENPDAFDIARKGPRHSLAWRRARFFCRGTAFDQRDQTLRRAALSTIDRNPGTCRTPAKPRAEIAASNESQRRLAAARRRLPHPPHPPERGPDRAAPNPAALRRTPALRSRETGPARWDCSAPIRRDPGTWPRAGGIFDRPRPVPGPIPILARFWWNPWLTHPNCNEARRLQ